MKEFGVVKSIFKQNIKIKKGKRSNKSYLMRYKRKQSKTEKMDCTFIPKRKGCAQERKQAKK